VVAVDLDELDRRRGTEGHGKRLAPPRGADRTSARGSGGHAAEVEDVGALRHEGGLAAARGAGVAAAHAAADEVARPRHGTPVVLATAAAGCNALLLAATGLCRRRELIEFGHQKNYFGSMALLLI